MVCYRVDFPRQYRRLVWSQVCYCLLWSSVESTHKSPHSVFFVNRTIALRDWSISNLPTLMSELEEGLG